MTIEFIPVTSSNLHSVGYDADNLELHVRFKNGGIYVYSGVEPAMHAALLAADSAGKHFNEQIKGGGYEWRKG